MKCSRTTTKKRSNISREALYPQSVNKDNIECWQSLAMAIVVCAFRDYTCYLQEYNDESLAQNYYRMVVLEDKIKSLQNFFRSKWCEDLIYMGTNGECYLEGDAIIEKIAQYAETLAKEDVLPWQKYNRRKENMVANKEQEGLV